MAGRKGAVVGLALMAALGLSGRAPAQQDNQARLLVERARAEEARGAHDAALADFTRAVEMHALPPAEQSQLLLARGLVLDGQGRLDDAAADYSGALKLAPRLAPALNNRANVYRRQGRLAEARRDYLASLAAGNTEPEYSWYGLGEVAEAQDDPGAARRAYARALAANPDYRPAADRLAGLGSPAAGRGGGEPIHLHLPASASNKAPVVLRPPPRRHVAPAAATALIAAANYAPDQNLALRAALDQGPAAQIQLGAWRSEVEAAVGWNRAVHAAGDLLKGLSPHVVAADLPGKGRYYRLRAGPVESAPLALCQALQARGLACMPVHD